MMPIATWLSVFILGPGAVAIFVWFLFDVKRIFRRDDHSAPHETSIPP